MNLHIAISTGQNVANIIPILELGSRNDRVLFINSETADKSGWTLRAAAVLKKHGFLIEPHLNVDDTQQLLIYPLIRKIQSLMENHYKNGKIFVHLTGGQKMTAISLFEAFKNRPVKYVYMDNQPVQIISIDSLSQKYERISINKHIRLQDILKIYGSKFFGERQKAMNIVPKPLPIFAFNKKLISGLLKAFDVSEEFSTEQQHILKSRFNIYDNHIFKNIKDKAEDIYNKSAGHPVLRHIPIDRLDKKAIEIKHGLKQLLLSGRKITKETLFNPPKNISKLDLSAEEKEILVKYGFLAEEDIKGDLYARHRKRKIGDFFEEQVFERLMFFLSENPQYKKVISEVWKGLSIASVADENKITGEYDIYILLKNGLGISLECKSFLFEEKDLFARIARLTRRTSQLSQQWVVFPFFTDSELFRERMFKQYEVLKNIGIPFIPFDLYGQTNMYEDPQSGKKIKFDGFEESLKKLLKNFLN